MAKRFFVIVLSIVVWSLLLNDNAYAVEELRLDPEVIPGADDTPVLVDVISSSDLDVRFAQFTVEYDSTLVRYTGVDAGDIPTFLVLFAEESIGDKPQSKAVTVGMYGGPDSSYRGPEFWLATLRFRVLECGLTTLSFNDACTASQYLTTSGVVCAPELKLVGASVDCPVAVTQTAWSRIKGLYR